MAVKADIRKMIHGRKFYQQSNDSCLARTAQPISQAVYRKNKREKQQQLASDGLVTGERHKRQADGSLPRWSWVRTLGGKIL